MADVTPGAVQPLPAAFRHLSLISDHNTTAAHADFAQSHAILIGINDYANGIQRLTTATHDAEVLAALLADQHGYQVQRLTTAVSKATLTELFTQHLPATIQADDRLLVYFAGHGIALDGEDGPAGYLIPQDARPEAPDSFLAMRDFNQWLSQLRCRHLLVILDCCFAGAFRWASTRNLKPLPDKLYRERFERFIRDPAWQVLTSAAYDQKALDFLTGNSLGERGQQNGHSPFAQALFAALAGKGDLVPAGGDGVITATELYLYLRDFVEVAAEQQAHHRQTPGLWPLQKHDKGEFIFFVPGQAVNLEPAPTLTTENNPYRGLASYDYSAKDARLFFGRTKLIDELATLVEQHGLTLVLGASGTGKSSLVKAGLLPKLHPPGAAGAADAATWQVLPPMRPTDQPLRVLHHLLTHQLANGSTGDLLADLSRLTEALVKLVDDWCQAHAGQRLLLMVDQLEELITLCRNDAERTAFLALLAALLHSQPNQLRIVLTLRSDFEPQFAKSPLFAQPTPPVTRFIVSPLSQDELREVIEGPAAASTLFFEDSQLVDDLINEVVQTPGALPLLSFTLEQLYLRYLKRQEAGQEQGITIDRALTRADYHALGGVIGSLNQRASEEYDKLPDDAHRATLQRVMLRMVAVEGGEVARRRVLLAEFEYPSTEENSRVALILDRLVEARLVVTGSNDADGDGANDAFAEPAHDALVRAWDKLRLWQAVVEQALPLTLHNSLTQAATEWASADEKSKNGLLWNNNPWLPLLTEAVLPDHSERMDALTYWLNPGLLFKIIVQVTTKPTRFNRQETRFIQASAERKKYLWRRTVGITLAVIVTLAGIGAVALVQRNIAISAQADAEKERDAAQKALAIQFASQSQVAAEQNLPQRRLLLAVEAMSIVGGSDNTQLPRVEQALRDALSNSGGIMLQGVESTVQSLAISADSRWLVLGEESGALTFWDLYNTEAPVARRRQHKAKIRHTQFDPNQQYLATCDDGGVCYLWRYTMGVLATEPISLSNEANLGSVTSLGFSPDGHWLAAGTGGSKIQLWNLWNSTPQTSVIILETGDLYVTDVEFSPNSQWLAAVGGGTETTAHLWNLTTESFAVAEIRLLGSHTNEIREVAFSFDMRWIATASWDGTARLWDLSQGEISTVQPYVLDDHEGGVMHVAFSKNNRWLVTGGIDFNVRLWPLDVENPSAVSDELTGHTASIAEVIISPDSNWLLTTDDVGLARLWVLSAYTAEIRNEVFKHGQAQPAWSLPLDLRGHEAAIRQVAISPDQRWIITVDAEGFVRLWDFTSLDPGTRLPVFGGDRSALSPDNRWLATSDSKHNVYLWDLSLQMPWRSPIAQYSHAGRINAVAFNPDGRWLLTVSEDHNAYALPIEQTGPSAHPILLTGHQAEIRALAISADSQWAVTGSIDSTARIWSLHSSDPASVHAVLDAHTDGVIALAIDAQSQRLLTGSLDRTARLWNLQAADINASSVLVGEHDDYVNDLAFATDGRIVTGSGDQDNSARLWTLGDSGLYQEIVAFPEHNGPLLVTPTGDWLVSSSWGGEINLWDITADIQPEKPVVLGGHRGSVWAMDIAYGSSNENALLVTGSDDKTVRLWNLSGDLLNIEPVILNAHRDNIRSLMISTDRRWLVTSGDDGVTRLWTLELDELVDLACNIAGRNLSWNEWVSYFGTIEYRQTCPEWVVHPSVIEHFLTLGEQFAQRGQLQLATTEYQRAIDLDPSQTIQASQEAERVYNQMLAKERVKAAEEFANALELDRSIHKFREAILLDPLLNIDPEARAKEIIVPTLINQGWALARQADVSGAIAKLTYAKLLDPSREIEPEQEAKELALEVLVSDGTELAQALKIDEAKAKFQRAAEIEPKQADIFAMQASSIALDVLIRQIRATSLGDEIIENAPNDLQREVELAIALSNEIDHAYWHLQLCLLSDITKFAHRFTNICNRAINRATYISSPKVVTSTLTTLGGDVWAITIKEGQGIATLVESKTFSRNGAYTEKELLASIVQHLYTPNFTQLATTTGWTESAIEMVVAPIDGVYLLVITGDNADTGIYAIQTTTVPTNVVSARQFMEEGRSLAQNLDFEGAIEKFQIAKMLDSSIEISPTIEVGRIVAEQFVLEASSLARDLRIPEATAKFEQAIKYDDSIIIEPATEAKRIAFDKLMMDLDYHVRYSDDTDAQEILAQIIQLSEVTVSTSATDWNLLCWWGALLGHATDVASTACEHAVFYADPDNLVGIRDSRGLARALVGDIAGAIEDFRYYITYAEDNDAVTLRRKWLQQLEAGIEPSTIFTSSQLEQLRTE